MFLHFIFSNAIDVNVFNLGRVLVRCFDEMSKRNVDVNVSKLGRVFVRCLMKCL